MPITPILPVTLDALRATALGDGLREGRILEARVTAVLSNTLARIEINGQPLMVTMTKPLPVGVALTLKVEREAGELKLIAQGPARDMPEAPVPTAAPTSPPRTAGIPTDPVKAALAKIQTMTVESMLDDNPAAEAPPTQSLASMVGAQAAPAPHLAPRIPVQPGQNDAAPPAPPAASGEDAPEGVERRTARIETPEFRQVHVSSDALSGHGRTERAPTFAVEIPVFLPGNDVPLRLYATEHEEAARQEGEEPHSPYWTVRFAAEAGQLGMVHAAISLIDGHVGVQLRAEREETAEQFRQNAAQLRDALQASDLKLDAVSITQGGPPGDR
jgi:hypothetical protein